MTIPAVVVLYEAQHVHQYEGRPLAVFNPHNKPVAELPVIYGFNNGGSRGWMSAVLLAQDGAGLGGHCCSSEAYMPADLGCLEGTRFDRHETFREHYPDGYRMEFVPGTQVLGHAGLMESYRLNQLKGKEAAMGELRIGADCPKCGRRNIEHPSGKCPQPHAHAAPAPVVPDAQISARVAAIAADRDYWRERVLALESAAPAVRDPQPQPFTKAQLHRLYVNSPELHKDAPSEAAFTRIVQLAEQAHGIGGGVKCA